MATKTGSHGRTTRYGDGIEVKSARADRWQKGGHDRLYPKAASDGYVDLAAGEVVDLEPDRSVGCGGFEFDYDAERDVMVLQAEPAPKLQHQGEEPNVVAEIPREVLND